jgi:hypothetical protein
LLKHTHFSIVPPNLHLTTLLFEPEPSPSPSHSTYKVVWK